MRLVDADALKLDIMCVYGSNPKYINWLNHAPTVDAVPVRHGKWLPKHHYVAGHEFVSGHICSECGDDALNAEGDEFLTDYCPNCGARMDAE